MELGMIIVLALAGVYTTILVVGAVMEVKGKGHQERTIIHRGRPAA